MPVEKGADGMVLWLWFGGGLNRGFGGFSSSSSSSSSSSFPPPFSGGDAGLMWKWGLGLRRGRVSS